VVNRHRTKAAFWDLDPNRSLAPCVCVLPGRCPEILAASNCAAANGGACKSDPNRQNYFCDHARNHACSERPAKCRTSHSRQKKIGAKGRCLGVDRKAGGEEYETAEARRMRVHRPQRNADLSEHQAYSALCCNATFPSAFICGLLAQLTSAICADVLDFHRAGSARA
jgi:hypothetical protein